MMQVAKFTQVAKVSEVP